MTHKLLLILLLIKFQTSLIGREKSLETNEVLKRLLFDADNAEQWLTERELIVERPIKVRFFGFQ